MKNAWFRISPIVNEVLKEKFGTQLEVGNAIREELKKIVEYFAVEVMHRQEAFVKCVMEKSNH